MSWWVENYIKLSNDYHNKIKTSRFATGGFAFFVLLFFNHFQRKQNGNDDTADYVYFYENRNNTKHPADDCSCYGNPSCN